MSPPRIQIPSAERIYAEPFSRRKCRWVMVGGIAPGIILLIAFVATAAGMIIKFR